MSGICGAWSFDRGDPDLDPVLALLGRRGPDGTHHWAEGPIALGHTLLATTPEALVEVLPLTEPDSGCTITADARLDNRDELIAALDLGGESRTIGDGELILRAYLKWGEECPTHLLGDFAFAIWDGRAERLFCVRDHMGMRQFNYHHAPGKLFAFATVDTALIALEAVPGTINEPRIADFIADLESFDFTSTFFDRIHRLPPAHSLSISGSGCNIRRYWTLRPGLPLRLESDQAYGAAFLDVFTEAVRCRLRSAGTVAAMLSGGLDSSSMVAIAAKLLSATRDGPLTTISAIRPDATHCAETIAIQSAITIEGLNPTFVTQSDLSAKFGRLVAEMEDARNPFEVNGTMLRRIYIAAKDLGINVVLDGGAGDVTLTSDNRIAALLSMGRIGSAIRETLGAVRFWKVASPRKYVVKELLAAAWVVVAPVKLRSLRRRFQLSRPLAEIDPHFTRRVGLADRRRTADSHISMNVKSEPARRAQSILHPNLAAGRERFDQLAGTFGVESRDPFMDIRLIEFCLSLPPEQLQAGGWPKIILRRAIEGMVPHDIAWRQGKEHLGGDFTKALLASWDGWQESMCDPHSPLKRYVSAQALRDVVKHRNDPTGATLRLFALDRFLRRYDVQSHGH